MNRGVRKGWSSSAWAMLLILLAGAALRFYRLDAQSFWGDEAFSALIAAGSLDEVLNNAFASVHPPGYYLLLHLWRRAAGGTDLALRYPSAFLGTLGIVLTYQLGRTMVFYPCVRSKRLGSWAAGITALAPFHVFYSQEARMYTLLHCFACVLMLAYLRLWRLSDNRIRTHDQCPRWWGVFVLTSIVGLWIHFFTGLIIAVVDVHFCLRMLATHLRLRRDDPKRRPRTHDAPSPFKKRHSADFGRASDGAPSKWRFPSRRVGTAESSPRGREDRPTWLGFLTANGAIALALGLYWPRFLSRADMVSSEIWRTQPALSELLGLPMAFTISRFLKGTWQVVASGCVLFLVIIVGLQVARALWQRTPSSSWLFLLTLMVLVPVAGSFAVSQFWKSVFVARVLIIVVPAFYLLIAWSAVHTRERVFNQFLVGLLLPLALFGIHNWFFDPGFAKPPVRDAAHLVQESELADAPVIHAIGSSYKIFGHYAPDLDNRLLSDSPMSLRADEVLERMGNGLIDPDSAPEDGFWFVVFPIHSHEFQFALRDDFDARFNQEQAWDIEGVQIYYYAHADSEQTQDSSGRSRRRPRTVPTADGREQTHDQRPRTHDQRPRTHDQRPRTHDQCPQCLP